MSAPHRPSLLRFTLALLGMLLLMALGFAGLGWMVARDFGRVSEVIGGKNARHLWHWYFAFMVNSMSGDRDGDGVCDGAELFLHSDPNNPQSDPGVEELCLGHPTITSYCGERLTTRWTQKMNNESVRWPRGFRAIVSANQPVLLPKGGTGPPTKGPLTVAVNERGEVEFDILAERIFSNAYVEFRNAATHRYFGVERAFFPGWRLPPLPASIDGGPAYAAFRREHNWQKRERAEYDMGQVIRDGWNGDYVIEAARELGDGGWQPILAVESKLKDVWFSSGFWDFFPGYTGPLKFRVVPVSATPPGAGRAGVDGP